MTDTPTFEANLQQLEELLGQLERNELPLEQSLQAFAKGSALITTCEGQLAQAETTVQTILVPAVTPA